MTDAAVGFRTRTGRAVAVVLSRGDGAPAFVWRQEVSLVDPSLEIGPYHTVMELPWSEAVVAVQPLVSEIEGIADNVLREIVADMRSRGLRVKSVGVVGSPPRDLARIGNPHIRAHAAEGTLFRRVLETAAKRLRIRCSGYTEDEVAKAAKVSAAEMKRIGAAAGRPWRVDERLAAMGAWAVLTG